VDTFLGPGLGGHINTLYSHLKHVLKQTFRPKYAKKQCGKKLKNNIVLVPTGLEGASTLCSHLKTCFKKNLDQICLKMLYFLEKNEKIAAAVGDPPPNPRWSLAAEDSASRPPSC